MCFLGRESRGREILLLTWPHFTWPPPFALVLLSFLWPVFFFLLLLHSPIFTLSLPSPKLTYLPLAIFYLSPLPTRTTSCVPIFGSHFRFEVKPKMVWRNSCFISYFADVNFSCVSPRLFSPSLLSLNFTSPHLSSPFLPSLVLTPHVSPLIYFHPFYPFLPSPYFTLSPLTYITLILLHLPTTTVSPLTSLHVPSPHLPPLHLISPASPDNLATIPSFPSAYLLKFSPSPWANLKRVLQSQCTTRTVSCANWFSFSVWSEIQNV